MIHQAGCEVGVDDPNATPAAGLAWRTAQPHSAVASTQGLAQADDLRNAPAAVRVLAERFHTPVPEVTSRPRTKGTSSQARRREMDKHVHYQLAINERSTDIESAVLHEFAHVLTWHERGPHHHNWFFFSSLRRVAAFWYGQPVQYPWNREYRRIRDLARQAGLAPNAPSATGGHGDVGAETALPAFGLEPAAVRTGDEVLFTFRGKLLAAQVLSARRGSRARVRAEDGLTYMVPQHMLTVA